jgi:hypothetical protein
MATQNAAERTVTAEQGMLPWHTHGRPFITLEKSTTAAPMALKRSRASRRWGFRGTRAGPARHELVTSKHLSIAPAEVDYGALLLHDEYVPSAL